MPTVQPYDPDRFTYNEVRPQKSVRIICTCNYCGASKVVSHFDGSLENWEENHDCEIRAKAS